MLIDLLIHNARILTQDPAHPVAENLLVHNGTILAVDEPKTHLIAVKETIDAQQAIIAPGFNDAHAHSVWFGLTLTEADLSKVTTPTAAYDIISEAAASLPPDQWVIASRFNPLALDGHRLDRKQLDAAAGNRPVWIKHSSGHACTTNSAGLALIAQNHNLSGPIKGGVVVTDKTGHPTGLLEENAMRLVQDIVLPYPLETIEKALDLATAHYLTEGITSVTDAGIAGGWIGHSPQEFAAYQNARDHGRLHVRTQVMIVLDALNPLLGHIDDPLSIGLSAGVRTGLGDDWLRLGPVKIFSDGSLLGSTAYMSEDYVGCPDNHGYLQMSADDLQSSTLNAYSAGWAIAMHAIGDRAVDFAIDLIIEAQEKYGSNTVPNRIEHGGVVRPDQLDRIAKAGIVLVPQPHFIAEFGDQMADLLGPDRTALSYPAKSLLARGAVLPGSSDRPVSNGRPLDVMQAFVERLTPNGLVYGADERISAEQALAAYTRGSATATGSSNKGRVMPGCLADLVFLDDDPTTVPSSLISAVTVLGTMINGRMRYDPHREFTALSISVDRRAQ